MIAQFASIITLAWTLPSTTRVGGQPSMLARVADQPSMLARAFFGDTESIYKDADLVFAVLDKDGSGVIEQSELTTHLTRAGYTDEMMDKYFGKADFEENGVLSKDELREAFLTYTPLRCAPALGSSSDGATKEQMLADAEALFNAIDQIGDHRFLNYEELQAYMADVLGFSDESIATVFEKLDLNSDGVITREELANTFVKYSAVRLALRPW